MSSTPSDDDADRTSGVILKAANGDVIAYDRSGLILKLSDRVIADIAARLGPMVPVGATGAAEADDGYVDLPDDIDAWDLRPAGEWLRFTADLPGQPGPRGYVRHRSGGPILAEARGPLLGLLGIGGARAALGATEGATAFPYNMLAPGDDVGAAGLAGTEAAAAQPVPGPVRDRTHEALIAEAFLEDRRARHASLPLFFVRAETDGSHAAAALATGPALANLEQAAANLVATARALDKPARLVAVTLDYGLEDLSGDATAYRDGMIALMAAITGRLERHGLAAPLFLADFDCGTHRVTEGPALDGQWELSWNHGAHRFIHAAPGYMFAQDGTGRLTDDGRAVRAAIFARAIAALEAGEEWRCPVLHLAEATGRVIRVTCAGLSALELAADDPFGAGPLAGFGLQGAEAGQAIERVEVDPDDRLAVLIHCALPVQAAGLSLTYAHGAAPGEGPYPANAGALRDGWSGGEVAGWRLHRWALPARLPVRRGGGAGR